MTETPSHRHPGAAARPGSWFRALLRVLGYNEPMPRIERLVSPSATWIAVLLNICALSIFLFAVGINAVRGIDAAEAATFWSCILLAVLPLSCRLVWPDVSRIERFTLAVGLGAALFAFDALRMPIQFKGHDEYLHVATALDLAERHHLFTLNPLLPISALYPSLEIVANALMSLSGLELRPTALLMLGVVRVGFVAGLFLIFERVSRSSYVAAIACLIYMANSNFFGFFAEFSYGTLAVLYMVCLMLLAMSPAQERARPVAEFAFIALPLVLALTVGHHLTAYITFGILLAIAGLGSFLRVPKADIAWALAIAVPGLALSYIWSGVASEAAGGYLSGIFGKSASGIFDFFTFGGGRALFQSDDGTMAPLYVRVTGLLSVVLLCTGLSLGFFRALGMAGDGAGPRPGLGWLTRLCGMGTNPWAILFTVATLGYPIGIVLRLIPNGWELANRSTPFVFLGVGFVVAVSVAAFWQNRSRNAKRAAAVGSAIALVVVGGIISGAATEVLPTSYRPAADGRSIEPMGIEAAQFTRERLGNGWRFAADRVNRLLLATYGMQRPVTQLHDKFNLGEVVFSDRFDGNDVWLIRKTQTEFILVDTRLSGGLPLFGDYFEAGEDWSLHKYAPDVRDLTKFERVPGIGRPFDNGRIHIYDFREFTRLGQPLF